MDKTCRRCGIAKLKADFKKDNRNPDGCAAQCLECARQEKRVSTNYITEDHFWPKVCISESCWNWLGQKTYQGYGRLYDENGNEVRAHRWLYEHLYGQVPIELPLDHLCRNAACVNPLHLEVVTHGINVLRGVGPSALNARKTHCPRGHPYDLLNTYYNQRGKRYCRICSRVKAPNRAPEWVKGEETAMSNQGAEE